ncbi:MAG: NADH-quinone oxidoreductase subunit A [Anaerolineae bacterium]
MVRSEFVFVGILAVVAALLPIAGLGIASLIRPKKPNPIKQSTYECGIETIGDAWVQFRAQYYIYALVFVVFDIEAVFLLPWAVAYDQLSLYAFVEVVIFVVILVLALVYAWRKGALRWS